MDINNNRYFGNVVWNIGKIIQAKLIDIKNNYIIYLSFYLYLFISK